MFNISEIFKTKAPEAAPAPAPTSPVGTPTVAVPEPTVVIDPNNPTAPVPPVDPAVEPAPEPAPLDEFKNLWETVPSKETDPSKPTATPPLNAENLQKAMAKTDFSKVVTAEQLAAIGAGGDEAQKAFAEAMNAVAQNVMVQSTMVNSKLNEQAIKEAVALHTANLPELLREQAAANHLANTNPLLANPAVKPVADATRARLLEHYPNATNEQLTEMTQNFIIAMGESITPTAPPTAVPGEQDWNKFLTP